MAKVRGLSPSKMVGSVGDYTYRKTKFGTVVSEKIQKGRKMPSLAQARARYQITNLANLAAVLLPAIMKGFEKAVGSEIGAFTAANRGMQPVFIPKYLAESRACIVVPCQMTAGSLPPVRNSISSGKCVSNIAVGNFAFGASATVADLSNAIISNNDDWRDGDQLSLVVATQKVVTISQRTIPTVELKKYEIILGSSSTPLSEIIPQLLLGVVDNCIAMNAALVNQGAGFIHSRTVEGQTKVSTAFMVASNDETISAYNTTAALIATAESYGGYKEDAFLDTQSVRANTTGPGTGEADPSNPGGQGGGSSETHTVTFTSAGNGSVTASRVDNGNTIASGSTVAKGTAVRLQANPSSGYAFSKWSDDNTSNPRIVDVNSDITLTATFVENAGGGGGEDDDIG